MPLSSFAVIPIVIHELVQLRPKSVLDLGVGFGLYGAAIRNWLDDGTEPYHVLLHGVEGWPKYRSPLWTLYHHIWEARIQDVEIKQKYDAIIMMDVLEHFEKSEGVNVLIKIVSNWLKPGGTLLISTPAVFVEQGPVNGNKLEIHRSLWTPQDMERMNFVTLQDGSKGDQYCHYMHVFKYIRNTN